MTLINNTRLVVILGPTSTGKTDLALNLAKKFNGELLSCLNIKYQISNIKKRKAHWEIEGVKISMYDVADPKKQYTVYDFIKDATPIIDDILKRGKLPIIVGGTGLYLKALLEGIPNLGIPVSEKLRMQLQKLSKDELQGKLQQIAPDRWERMNYSDRQNPRRLIRAIEIVIQLTVNKLRTQDDKGRSQNDTYVLKIGLTAPRDILYQRIDKRVIIRVNQGMIDEAQQLHKRGLSLKRMRQLGLEYGVLADFLEGKIHGFARRQLTWFKKEKNVSWVDTEGRNYFQKVENLICKWYDNPINVA
ncbi:MAG: tRNA dimethylallyltransferase [Candidatus Daviesbacteria bacterium GW2011_GWB1_39_5]|nr:MAG: tRNA dimethylallyltransferase [Candidatus Daviesbacteria bacterium GW2011_GWB1_39_5]